MSNYQFFHRLGTDVPGSAPTSPDYRHVWLYAAMDPVPRLGSEATSPMTLAGEVWLPFRRTAPMPEVIIYQYAGYKRVTDTDYVEVLTVSISNEGMGISGGSERDFPPIDADGARRSRE